MENMKSIENLSEVLDDELKKIAKKGDNISPVELENAYKAMKTLYYGEAIKAMSKKEKEQGQSQEYSQRGGGNSRNSYGSYDMMPDWMSNAGGQSNAGGSYESSGRSYENSGRGYGNSNEGQSNEGGSGDYSERRGRNQRTGRYMSRDGGSYGYSGHEEKEQLRQQIMEMQRKLEQM